MLKLRVLLSIVLLQCIVIHCNGLEEVSDERSSKLLKLLGVPVDVGTPIISPNDSLRMFADEPSCVGVTGFQCLDCSSYQVCYNDITLYQAVCPSDKPYCEKGSCTDTLVSTDCKATTVAFKCSMDGFFPDPVDCQRYYHCAKDADTGALVASPYTCPASYAYDTLNNKCVPKTAAICKTFTCKANKMVAHPVNPAYYTYCTSNTVSSSSAVFRCPDTKNMAINVDTNGCEYKCRQEGYFEDIMDNTKFFFCYRDPASKLVARQESCPQGLTFQDGSCKEAPLLEKNLQHLREEHKVLLNGINQINMEAIELKTSNQQIQMLLVSLLSTISQDHSRIITDVKNVNLQGTAILKKLDVQENTGKAIVAELALLKSDVGVLDKKLGELDGKNTEVLKKLDTLQIEVGKIPKI